MDGFNMSIITLYEADLEHNMEALVYRYMPNGEDEKLEVDYYDPIISIKLNGNLIIVDNSIYAYELENVEKILVRSYDDAENLEGYGTLMGTEITVYQKGEDYE